MWCCTAPGAGQPRQSLASHCAALSMLVGHSAHGIKCVQTGLEGWGGGGGGGKSRVRITGVVVDWIWLGLVFFNVEEQTGRVAFLHDIDYRHTNIRKKSEMAEVRVSVDSSTAT